MFRFSYNVAWSFGFVCSAIVLAPLARSAEVIVVHDRISSSHASPSFQFSNVPSPAANDAAARGTFSIRSGERDPNGGQLEVLNDGKLPLDEDQPAQNFFFRAGTAGGTILLDLGRPVEISRVNTYSWHPAGRGPQVYKLYAAASEEAPAGSSEDGAWTYLAEVDTRPADGEPGGQYGASISRGENPLGTFRHLLFKIASTASDDPFSNTFYSEIDVIEKGAETLPIVQQIAASGIRTLAIQDKYEIRIDASSSPDLLPWIDNELSPVVREWYPRLVEMLPSEGFEAPTRVTITFEDDMRGVASASGNRIRCASSWFRRNLDGEGKGAVVHELVHVVQQYGWGRRNNPDASRTPGWVTEGIPDYIRWFLYEPESKGAEITRRNFDRAQYDGNYRITANFLNWVVQNHGEEIIPKLNAAAREGRYSEQLWVDYTGKSLEELNTAWRGDLEAAFPEAAGG